MVLAWGVGVGGGRVSEGWCGCVGGSWGSLGRLPGFMTKPIRLNSLISSLFGLLDFTQNVGGSPTDVPRLHLVTCSSRRSSLEWRIGQIHVG
jgi:hypothetical protein